jgi:hypothetical protein
MAKNPRHSEKQQFPRPPHNKTEKTYATKNSQTIPTTKPKNRPPSHTTTIKSEKSPTSSDRQTDIFVLDHAVNAYKRNIKITPHVLELGTRRSEPTQVPAWKNLGTHSLRS